MIIAASDDTDGSHTEEDENYFVSMTDMMVGILFIFIIMLMVFALNFRQLTDETVQLTAEQQEQLNKADELAEQIAALRKQIANEIVELNKADQARNELLEAIKAKLDLVGLKVTVDKDTGVLRLAEDAIRFAPQSSQLDVEAQRNVDAVAKVLVDVLPVYTACPGGTTCQPSTGYVVETVFIEGHTDKTGSDSLNWQLSTERAVNTYRRIVDNFPELRALVNSGGREILSVSGYAYTRPAIEQDDTEGYRINRRIDLRFVMEADRRERLSEVLVLLEQMERKVSELQNPLDRAPEAATQPRLESP
jgi:flagellar motor protein MotB